MEKPRPEDAKSNLAVIGRYVFTPGIFDALERITPGVGGELQLTDAIELLLEHGVGVRPRVHRTAATTSARSSTSSAPTSSSRSTRPDLGPELADYLARTGARPVCRDPVALIPLADVQAAIFGAVTRLEPVEVDLRDALGLVLAEQVTAPEAVPPFPNTAMDGYAVRAADTAGAAEGRTGAAARRRRAGRPATRPRSRSATARRSAS